MKQTPGQANTRYRKGAGAVAGWLAAPKPPNEETAGAAPPKVKPLLLPLLLFPVLPPLLLLLLLPAPKVKEGAAVMLLAKLNAGAALALLPKLNAGAAPVPALGAAPAAAAPIEKTKLGVPVPLAAAKENAPGTAGTGWAP